MLHQHHNSHSSSANHMAQQGLLDLNEPSHAEELFHSTSLDMLVNSTFQQSHKADHIQVIKGEYGIGKTCLAKRLFYETRNDSTVYLAQSTHDSNIGELLKQLLPNASLQGDDPQTLAVTAANYLLRQLRNQQQPIFVLDDAHELPSDTLSALLRYLQAISKQGFGHISLVLLAERGIDQKLAQLDTTLLNQDKIYSTLLRPLNRNEINDYINFRLASSSPSTNQGKAVKLKNKQLSFIQERSGGLPYKIDQLSGELLNHKSLGSLNPRTAIIAGVSIAIAGFIGYQFLPQHASPPATPAIQATSQQAPAAADTHLPLTASADTLPTPNNKSIDASADTDVAKTQDVSPTTVATNNPLQNEVTFTNSGDIADTALQIESELNTTSEPDIAESQAIVIQDTDSLSDQHEFTRATNVANKVETTNASHSELASGSSIAATASEPKLTQWLHQQPADHYVIQLVGAWNMDSLQAYSATLELPEQLIYHQTTRNTQQWHVLLYGPFPNFEAANAAISSLPEEIQANKPWIRKIRSLNKHL